MTRTRNRPMVTGRVSVQVPLLYGVLLGVAGIVLTCAARTRVVGQTSGHCV
jgi:heme O synthase-like polyprenyltransferase